MFLYQITVFLQQNTTASLLELHFNDSMQTVYACVSGGCGSQQREVADGGRCSIYRHRYTMMPSAFDFVWYWFFGWFVSQLSGTTGEQSHRPACAYWFFSWRKKNVAYLQGMTNYHNCNGDRLKCKQLSQNPKELELAAKSHIKTWS